MSNDLSPQQREWSWCESELPEHDFREVLTEAQLIRCLEVFAKSSGGHHRDFDDFRNELTRRATDRQTRWLVGLTVVIAILTLALAALTVALWTLESGA